MKIKYLQQNKVTLSLEQIQLLSMLPLEYAWVASLKLVHSICLEINVKI